MFTRKLLIGTIALGLSSLALAQSGGTELNKLMKNGRFFLGAEGLYMEPSNSKLSYGIVDDDTNSDPDGKPVYVKPDPNLGLMVEGGYRSNAGHDILLAYTRLHTSDSDSVTTPDHDWIWTRLIHPDTPTFFGDEFFDQAEKASAKVDFTYKTVDLLARYLINVGNDLTLRLGVGARYANLETKLKVQYVQEDSDTADISLHSYYNGIGPRVTAKGRYKISNRLGLVTEVGTSFIIGKGDFTEYQLDTDYKKYGGTDIDARVHLKRNSTKQIVPEADIKVGLNYTYHTSDTFTFALDAGWQVINYFDVRNSARFVSDTREGVYTHHVTDVAFNGPYAGIKILF